MMGTGSEFVWIETHRRTSKLSRREELQCCLRFTQTLATIGSRKAGWAGGSRQKLWGKTRTSDRHPDLRDVEGPWEESSHSPEGGIGELDLPHSPTKGLNETCQGQTQKVTVCLGMKVSLDPLYTPRH